MREYEFADRLMGCALPISIVHDSREHAKRVHDTAVALGRMYEKTFTRFHEESELSHLNQEKTKTVSPE